MLEHSLAIEDSRKQLTIFQQVVAERWSVRTLEKTSRNFLENKNLKKIPM